MKQGGVSLDSVLYGGREKVIIEREAKGRLAWRDSEERRWRERVHNMTDVRAW